VTVLSTRDPVRLYTEICDARAASNVRGAQLIVGPRLRLVIRYRCFASKSRYYEQLFEEKLDSFTRLLVEQPLHLVRHRPPRSPTQYVGPLSRLGTSDLGGRGCIPQSGIRAGRYVVAADAGHHWLVAAPIAPFVDLYKRALTELGTFRRCDLLHIPRLWRRRMRSPSWRIGLSGSAFTMVSKERSFPAAGSRSRRREIADGALFVGSSGEGCQ